MKTNLACTQPKLCNMRGVDDLRCVKHPDGYAFMTRFHEPQEDGSSISVGVDLRVAHIEGNVCFTMRRVAEMVDGGDCSTAAMYLTPEAARDLIEALSKVIGHTNWTHFAGPLQVFNSRDSLKCLRKQRGLGSS